MLRPSLPFAILAVVLGLTISGYVVAQDSASPSPSTGTCASPEGSPAGSPVGVVMGTPADVPGSNADIAPSPEILYACGTPTGISSAQSD
jgi:hypothetical protein